MCCFYCCKYRTVWITMSIFSALSILTSAASIYMMVRMKDKSYIWDVQQDPANITSPIEINEIKLIVFWGVITLCALGILVGFLGLITARSKTCCLIGLYSFFTLILTLAFLMIGGLLLTITIAANKQIDEYCLNNQTNLNQTTTWNQYDPFTINFSRYFLNYIDQYQILTENLVPMYMCQKKCPCVVIDYLGKYNQANVTSMQFNGTFANSMQCLGGLQLISQYQQPLFDLIKYLETRFKCSGLCNAPVFSLFNDIRDGPNQSTCKAAIKTLTNESFGILSLLLLTTSLLIFCGFNAQYGLWRSSFDDSTKKDKKVQRSKNYMVQE